MESILNVQVSCFANYTSAENPAEVNLLQWLTSDKYREQVELIRTLEAKEERDRIKATLPAITPAGTFTQRAQDHLIKHSGFLQFDIDWKENTHITNYQGLKQQICNIPNVAYCGLSVSGKGFWGLIPIAYPEKHRQHFESLEKAFAHFGIVLDPAPKNVASLRGYSYDQEPYFNHQATIYQMYEKPERRTYSGVYEKGSEREKVDACLAEIERHRADLTGTYTAWFEIGCSLANAFGEDGRVYFHLVSQYHPDYSSHKTDRQYNACLKGNNTFTIATFFNYCAQAQIRYKDLVETETKLRTYEVPLPPAQEIISSEKVEKEVEPSKPAIEKPEKAAIYQVKELKPWDVEELESFFENASLPSESIQLLPWEKITDPQQFIRSHISYIKANNGKRSTLPHFERLTRLKAILEGTALQIRHTPLLHRAA
ncbi:BT4734/BF3469 family protein [Rufibacter glacialis]|uniref:BT4734/BF3469 family protein n=1 Tax=Rufibacter glacialis TaxID=1259555 RepID=A0A5M8QTG7_9BACT|nr:BT4734/BF3469 family protein [Rufibacter glacialis]KAA6437492.1 hypothetical protein FOE74_03035 [Rufibacter glacialis]GGK58920.1 hypothetical protein GCM10011405_03690 [Rufibacter glacialis]